MNIEMLALDLEATLIDNALNAEPRPGLRTFLEYCETQFSRIALFTTVEESDAREVVADLVESGEWPRDLADRLEYVEWGGEYKDLRFVANAVPTETILVDDDRGWVRKDQEDQWLSIHPWHGGADDELARIKHQLNAMQSKN